ncbi:uncharacterized protein LOC105948358 [Xenopus tropicalis]|uniref:Uncharacterized protein LOC105948358 n=1 Tax=Xenopus tropicalis TaxID=8364 RepID=A0A8J1IZ00_XENTR|nr:uncharacterized protein LOC105948358 [Xenopus tropicalis]
MTYGKCQFESLADAIFDAFGSYKSEEKVLDEAKIDSSSCGTQIKEPPMGSLLAPHLVAGFPLQGSTLLATNHTLDTQLLLLPLKFIALLPLHVPLNTQLYIQLAVAPIVGPIVGIITITITITNTINMDLESGTDKGDR